MWTLSAAKYESLRVGSVPSHSLQPLNSASVSASVRKWRSLDILIVASITYGHLACALNETGMETPRVTVPGWPLLAPRLNVTSTFTVEATYLQALHILYTVCSLTLSKC